MNLIKDGDRAIIGHDGIYKIMVVKKGKHASFAKHKFAWDACIGRSWGHTWQIQQGKLEKLDSNEACGESVVSKVLDNIQSGADNRNAADLSEKGQNLERECIMEMREEKKGEELIEKIARGNADFESKTRFTQEKFVRHKQKKHGGRIEILKPSMNLIVHQKLAVERTKGAYFDVHEFATMIAMANIHANSKVLLADHSSCFLSGAILSKLKGGSGELVSVFQGQLGDSPPHVPLQNYEFPDEVWDQLLYYPAKSLGKATISGDFELPELKDEDEDLPPQAKKQKTDPEDNKREEDKSRISRRERQEKRLKKYSRAVELMKEKLECLIIAPKHHPLPWLFMLLPFLKPSCPFVVYCDKKEPLMEIFNKLHERKSAVMLSINSVFERTVQVLPMRTHPEVHMPGNRGYVLYGISVL